MQGKSVPGGLHAAMAGPLLIAQVHSAALFSADKAYICGLVSYVKSLICKINRARKMTARHIISRKL